MGVDQIYVRSVDTAELSETVAVVAERMHQRTVGALVVVDHSRIPLGIVTDRDLVIRAICKRLDSDTTHVSDVMSPNPQVISEDANIEDALDRMQRGAFRRMPVINARGHLTGIVTLDDIIRFYSKQLFGVAYLLARESPEMAAFPQKRQPVKP